MISSISLQRFRGFSDATLELKPLTVLLGANSAGKSSFLQAIAALHFIRRLRITPATLAPVGAEPASWPFDFGDRETLQRTGSREPSVGIGLRVDDEQGSTKIGYEFGWAGDRSLDLSRIDIDLGAGTAVKAMLGNPAASAPTSSEIGPVPGSEGTATIPLGAAAAEGVRIKRVGEGYWQIVDGPAVTPGFSNLQLEYLAKRTGTLIHVTGRQKSVLEALDAVRYLAPSRENPRREQRLRPASLPGDDVGTLGEWAGEAHLAMRNERWSFREPPPARIDRDQATGLLQRPRSEAQPVTLSEATDRWLALLGVGKRATAARKGAGVEVLVNVDGSERALTDVGFGVSQVLPIVIQALGLPKGGTLIVEQPEAQLHPRPQARLADFFCEMAIEGRNSLVETHSEAFFRRLHLRAMLDPDLASRIAVYFLDPVGESGCCNPVAVPLNDATAVRWPKEFLAETVRAHSAFAAVRASLAARALSGEKP